MTLADIRTAIGREPYFEEECGCIYLADCLDILPLIPDKTVDLALTDPPYFLPAAHYQTRKQFARNFSDLGILEHFFKDFLSGLNRIMKADGSGYVFCDGQSYPLFYYHIYHFSKSLRPLIWDKQTSINGYGWRHQHELILWFEMPQSKPIPTGDGDILKCRAVPIDDRDHPAEKPLDIIKQLIAKSTTADSVVLDPFLGSGTTAVAAKQLGRKYIGIEISQKYADIAVQRVQQGILI